MNFTTASTKVWIVVEGFPQVVDGLPSGLGTSVDKNTDLGLSRSQTQGYGSERTETPYFEHFANGIEEPTVGVDLLLVLFLHTEDNLRGHDALVRILELEIFVQPKSRRVFEEVSCDGLVVDHILHVVSRLVDT